MLKRFEKTYKGSGKYSFLILAGIHGNEYTALMVIPKLVELIKDEKKYKSITVVNGLNLEGIKKGSRDFIEKEKTADLNRAWNKIETFEDVKEKIEKLIEENDVVIDIHASPNCGEFVLVDNDSKTRFVIEWMKEAEVTYCIRECVGTTVKKLAWNKGKIGFTVECNGTYLVNIDSAKNTAEMIWRMIENVPTIPEKVDGKELFYDHNCKKLFFSKEGLVIFQKCGEYKKGELLATVYGLDGKELETIKAPEDGWMIAVSDCSFVRGCGEEICYQVKI